MSVACPIFFDGLAGMYHAAKGSTAVLMLSPWAYEELCSRKTFRIMGEKLAEAGYPCLRFDFPGTCHSALASDAIRDIEAWQKAAEAALDQLITLSSASRVILIGQGLGGLFAGELARKRHVAGVVYLGGVSQGRAHLREIAAWTAMTQPTFLVRSSDGPEGGMMAGGFVLSAETLTEIKGLNLLKSEAPKVERSLVVGRPGNPADVKLAEHLAAGGGQVDLSAFEGYVDYISNPTLSRLPTGPIKAVVSWICEHFPQDADASAGTKLPDVPAVLETPDYRESQHRFGPGGMFFCVLTEPASAPARTAILVLNAGYDHSCGWGRYTVDLAREMASRGYAVLRMDLAGIGETPYWPGQGEQVLYSTRQSDDVRCAIDWMKERLGDAHVLISGRCSGAYQAFVSAGLDERIEGAFLVNSRKLVWDPDEDVDQAIREPIQTLDTYRSKMTDPKQFKRLLSGELTVSTAVRKVTAALATAADRKLSPLLGRLSRHHRLKSVVSARLKTLAERNVPVALVYSEGDRGLLEIADWFGPDASGLSAYPNVTFSKVPEADHNLSPLPARADVTEKLLEFAGRFGAAKR
ncbi:alpha/beta fold hydrolase [Roseibium litorale]|uniref:Alpha/beta hydrolase family protein n=1 Tax=Roseibium litorale TaxID=2803841 RepID=A0ABR9CNK9_9HYPH|nr:alpha/beta fold hydrolase [Roseibium litorale]MBD8892425.1 hypothetical protein [Roseibium litorale]